MVSAVGSRPSLKTHGLPHTLATDSWLKNVGRGSARRWWSWGRLGLEVSQDDRGVGILRVHHALDFPERRRPYIMHSGRAGRPRWKDGPACPPQNLQVAIEAFCDTAGEVLSWTGGRCLLRKVLD